MYILYSKEIEKFVDLQRGSRTETERQWSAGGGYRGRSKMIDRRQTVRG